MAVTELDAIKGSKILMVGAGGIGCELLKTLALTGFKDVHIIDMDTIEVSNLNRQFLFRKKHVGQSKAKVARDAVLKFRPEMNIEAYHANVKDAEFDVDFFRKFSVVLNGLDNLDARRHVNRLCLAAGVPLVESGTTGFLGQVTVHVKGLTECYECQAKPAPKTYPVCTITSTPSKFVHCVVWAKELLFMKLFGDKNQATDLNAEANDSTAGTTEGNQDVFDIQEGESLDDYGKRVFDHVFGYNIEAALKKKEMWKKRRAPTPVYIKDIFGAAEKEQNGISSTAHFTNHCQSSSAMAYLGLKNPQEIWNIVDNARVFLKTMQLFFEDRRMEIGNIVFDKDDQLAVEFVTAAANIRASSFNIPMQSLFDTKGIAGNIVHAIPTTNAIIAGLIVIETIKLLRNDSQNYRMTFCLEHPSKKMLLMPVEPFEPNKSCYVCSKTPLSLEVNTRHARLKDVMEKVIKNKLGVSSPIIMHGPKLLFETGEDLEESLTSYYARNLEKTLSEIMDFNGNDFTLEVEDLQQEFNCDIYIKHREDFDEESDGFILSGMVQASESEIKIDSGNVKEQVPPSSIEPEGALSEVELISIETNKTCPMKRKHIDDSDLDEIIEIPVEKNSSGIQRNDQINILLQEAEFDNHAMSPTNTAHSLDNTGMKRKHNNDEDDSIIYIGECASQKKTKTT
eukprot:TRINITY_DN8157_c0_g1_i1.p1 TRINITY_DN8157_c0_g1~~TRINITY_DN8157_c0_g1_i1.p1  ORF type:complete len:679 (-),score=170.09 TRINITY_DN8157_c0_g1_i1:668-2704(-)